MFNVLKKKYGNIPTVDVPMPVFVTLSHYNLDILLYYIYTFDFLVVTLIYMWFHGHKLILLF